jgi:hypothetical protein
MRLKQILGGMTPAEKSALASLESTGRWAVMYDARIEDGFNPGGQRSRTFQRQGRYQLVLMLDPNGRRPATNLFAEPAPEPKADPVVELSEVVTDFPGNSPTKLRPVAWALVPDEVPAPKPESEPEPAAVVVKKVKKKK